MSQILLDTHVLLWWLGDDERLGATSRSRIANADNRILVSAASVWEIAIKRALGKLDAPEGLEAVIVEEGFDSLAIEADHAERAGALPALHRNPFDRMLVAQARSERLLLMTADGAIGRYDVNTIDAST